MSNPTRRRYQLLAHTAKQLDYWTPRYLSGTGGLEAEDQHHYYRKLMKYLVTQGDKDPGKLQDGANLVFPCL